MSRVLITGVAGFIGSHLADSLVLKGHRVSGVDNFQTGARENLHPEVDFLEGDIAGYGGGLFPPDEFDLIVHCAASYSDPNKWHRDTATNITGTINTVIKARAMGARLVYFQTALPPISSYAITKIAAEQFIELSAVDHVVFRLANIYGPRNLSGPIPTFYKRLTAGDPCSVVATTRDMVFVADLVDAVMRAVDNPDISGRYDLCSGKHRPIRELYDMVCGVMGSEDTATEVEAGADDVAKMELDPEPARADLGWEASTSLADGVLAAVHWYDTHGVNQTYTHLAVPEAVKA